MSTDPSQATPVPTDYGSPLTVDNWWDSSEADEVEGYDFVKDEALFALVGVPFIVTHLDYRAGIQQKGVEWRNDYCSAQLHVAPAQVFKRQIDRILSRRNGDLIKDKYAFAQPDEYLGINQGSTGVYRQFGEYLVGKDLITINSELPEKGQKNECRYDLPSSFWTLNEDAVRAGTIEQRFDSDGGAVVSFNIALRCPRGLRYSDYKNEFTDDDGAVTWYIA